MNPTDTAARASDAGRLSALRAELARRELDGFIVPRADEHQNEYVPPRAQRLAWLTGFTGSAGIAVVLADRAAIFVDGRYTIQVRQEVAVELFEPLHQIEQPFTAWLAANLPAGSKLGYDPWLHTVDAVERMLAACRKTGAELVAVTDNPIDAVWHDQPPPPLAPLTCHSVMFAGKPADEKIREIAEGLAVEKVDAAVLSAPDSIAWLLNVRGGDVAYTPLPLCFAVIHASAAVDLFIDRRKVSAAVAEAIGGAVTIHPPEAFADILDRLGAEGRAVRIDPLLTPAWAVERLVGAGARIDRGADPCSLPKACKNAVELEGIRTAHLRDGAALTRFLAWVAAEGAGATEIEAAERLEAFRSADPMFRDLSFPTISAAGPNGAVVHYHSTEATNRRLEQGQLYLVDSGAQYPDGTTDVTRTVAIGPAGEEERRRFTAVLRGHIALATARFPAGTTGSQLDALARRPLWSAGLDYDHGTGHGVGCYLGVHEGPQRISKVGNAVALRPGMVLSNEPGYYKAGAYGIRIENLMTVVDAPAPGQERPTLGFETLTMAPIDLNLVDSSQLGDHERQWLNGYHETVRGRLAPLLDPATAAWLAGATRPI